MIIFPPAHSAHKGAIVLIWTECLALQSAPTKNTWGASKMEIKVVSDHVAGIAADVLLLYVLQDSAITGAVKSVDEALKGAVGEVLAAGDLSGKNGETSLIYPRGALQAKRVVLVGLGERGKATPDAVRRAAAQGMRKAIELKAKSVVTVVPDVLDVAAACEAISEAAPLAAYSYHGQKSADKPETLPETLSMVTDDTAQAAQGVEAGRAIAAGVVVTRDLVNLPPNICTPAYMAQVAGEVAQESGLKIDVLEKKQIEALGMGALLGVAQGSETPPRFIILEHNADRASELDTIVLVGKGVTFDTGGYSLKTRDGMVGMKGDMGGGGAVIGAMRAIAGLKVPLHVVGLIPAADNMVSGKAYRPQDVLKASNGVTIEIISTDAEGRLLLADALVFASRYQPKAVVDIATLTGACMVALGAVASGLFCTDDALRDRLMAAGERTGERLWPLPLFDAYDKMIESQTADIKNSGGRYGGASTAAIFLKHFVDYPAWAHIDMAGMEADNNPGEAPYVPAKGATGYGVRLFTDFVRNWQA